MNPRDQVSGWRGRWCGIQAPGPTGQGDVASGRDLIGQLVACQRGRQAKGGQGRPLCDQQQVQVRKVRVAAAIDPRPMLSISPESRRS